LPITKGLWDYLLQIDLGAFVGKLLGRPHGSGQSARDNHGEKNVNSIPSEENAKRPCAEFKGVHTAWKLSEIFESERSNNVWFAHHLSQILADTGFLGSPCWAVPVSRNHLKKSAAAAMSFAILIRHTRAAKLITRRNFIGSPSMPKQYNRIFDRARAWAADTRYPWHKRQLAQALADNSAPLAIGMNLDDPTWEAFERFGCYVCNQLGQARCDSGKTPGFECPLGFGKQESDPTI
jgi:hypothetical protein